VVKLSWAVIKQQVYERAAGCCEYCQTCDYNTGQAMHIEHIDPDGGDSLGNLCLSCANCNLSKAVAITATDAVSGDVVPLFNPRVDSWSTHFEWIEGGLRVRGKTPFGRATVSRLRMNQERMVRARRNWIIAGNHPPSA